MHDAEDGLRGDTIRARCCFIRKDGCTSFVCLLCLRVLLCDKVTMEVEPEPEERTKHQSPDTRKNK